MKQYIFKFSWFIDDLKNYFISTTCIVMSVEVSNLQFYIIISTQETYFNYTIVCYEFSNDFFNCKTIFICCPYWLLPASLQQSSWNLLPNLFVWITTRIYCTKYHTNSLHKLLHKKVPQKSARRIYYKNTMVVLWGFGRH